MSILLLLTLFGAVYLDQVFAYPTDSLFWRRILGYPLLLVYTLASQRVFSGWTNRSIEVFRSLAKIDKQQFDQLVAEVSTVDWRREWLALLLGALTPIVLFRSSGSPFYFPLISTYVIATSTLMFAILAWTIYSALAHTKLMNALHRLPLDINVFDPSPLEPIARTSLGTALAFIGGITISLVMFYAHPGQWLNVAGVIIYGTLIVVAVVVFFLTMMETHRVMAATKEQEVRRVRHTLSQIYEELKKRTAKGELENMEALSDTITAWLSYQKVIEAAPEWPYTADILRSLLMSTLIPVAAWLTQVLVEVIK